MENNNSNKSIKQLVVVIVVLFIALTGFWLYTTTKFHMVKTNPKAGSITIITPFFKVYFNKPLTNQVLVTSSPNIITTYNVAGKTINLNLSVPLNPDQIYTINVSNIYDTSGTHLKDLHFEFQPSNVTTNSLPKDQSQALLNNQVQYNEAAPANNLKALLPFTEPNLQYKITYSTIPNGSRGNVTVFVITAENPKNQQAGVAWIKAQGFSPAQLNIRYIIGMP